jgi:hypothetical protein
MAAEIATMPDLRSIKATIITFRVTLFGQNGAKIEKDYRMQLQLPTPTPTLTPTEVPTEVPTETPLPPIPTDTPSPTLTEPILTPP